ncbi:MAG: rhomboid family intramembrane serine protease [Candidatus Aenigmarchaeota archaeon]|nr:rhomboid family intramembrane serine protease [Candidatus Aenigmarchaeota archaeon]
MKDEADYNSQPINLLRTIDSMKLTLILIAVMAAAFAVSLTGLESIVNFYGLSGGNFAARPYVIFTSIFLHADLAHLLSNVFALFFFGAAVEAEAGKSRMLPLFFAGALAGAAFSLLYYPPHELAIGASAGVFALVGAGMLLRPMDISFYPYFVPVPLALLGAGYILYNIYGFFFDAASNVSYVAHFGGIFVGLAYGFRRQGIKKSMLVIAFSAFALYLLAAFLLK